MRTNKQQRSSLPFSRDERGAVLIYVSIMLPVLIGFALLAVDASRVYNLQTQLQKAADALALAGAAELDRRPDSITRARNAINTLVANQNKFATEGVTITVIDNDEYPKFLQSLPASDATAITSANETADPLLARYVEVRLTPRTLNTILPATFVGATSKSMQMSATAVAGFTSVVCKLMPMFICNPFEGSGTSIFSADARGKQIKMRQGAKGEEYFPGNFGYLDPQGVDLDSTSGSGGTPELVKALASVAPVGCYEQNGVNQRTGDPQPAGSAINVRFDLWEPPLNSETTNAKYPPAPNVRRGYVAEEKGSSGTYDYCKLSRAPEAKYRLPRDSSYSGTYGHLGDGVWTPTLKEYWEASYNGESPPSGWAPSTRYDIYKYEISQKNAGGSAYVDVETGATKEKGSPRCYSGSGSTSNPDRRLLYTAIINCSALNVKGGSGPPMPVLAFGRFFVTEPVPPGGDPDAGTVFAEFVDVIQPGTVNNDVARDQVQLYR